MKQALIIGGSTGMGRAVAEILLEQGHEVAIVARQGENLAETETELSKKGKVQIYALDLSNDADVKSFSKKVAVEFPNLKYLVNAAGYFKPKTFLEHTEEDYEIYHAFNKAFFFIT